MRKGEKNGTLPTVLRGLYSLTFFSHHIFPGEDIVFDGVEGLKSPEFIQAIRNKVYEEKMADDSRHMALLASLCFAGPALEWFEELGDDVQTDWSLLRRALLARFPASISRQGGNVDSFRFYGLAALTT